MKGDKNMDYKTMRNQIEDMVNDNHKDFVKAIISVEKGINDESALDKLYDAYMDNDSLNLLHEEFDYMIEDLREQGQIKDLPYAQEEKDNLINIVGNIVGEVDVVERENKNGEAFKVANFSVVSKDDEGNKVYHNCSAYGEKSDIPKDFKQGDFVKLFGQIRTSIDDNGKEHSNIRILSSKLLKAKEQTTGQEEKKESVLGAIKKYQAEDKEKPKEKKEVSKEAER
ncbi:DNA-binding protein [Peptoniphilus sp. Marseille-Q6390]